MRTLHKPSGFTLVEILIVVIILGVLAAIVIPSFASATGDSKTNNLRQTLRTVRTQIEMFKAQHNNQAPQATNLWTLMLTQSNPTEATVAAPVGTAHGPYLQGAPINVYNGKTGVSTAAVDTNAGWYYQPAGLGFTFQARNADGSINTQY